MLGSLLWVAGANGPASRPQSLPVASPAIPLRSAVATPVWIGNGQWICPFGWPYAAYAISRQFYPPNHPLHPDLMTPPTRCFGSPRAAGAAGYSRAAPPAGGVEVDGVYLMPIEAALAAECRAASVPLGFPVPCPELLPSATARLLSGPCTLTTFGAPMRPPCVYGTGVRGNDAFVLDMGSFDVPPGFHTQEPENPAHLTLVAYRSPGLDTAVMSFLGCPDARAVGWLRLPGHPRGDRATLEACSSGLPPLDRQTLVRWGVDGITYVVGVGGFTSTSRDLAAAIARSVRLSSVGS